MSPSKSTRSTSVMSPTAQKNGTGAAGASSSSSKRGANASATTAKDETIDPSLDTQPSPSPSKRANGPAAASSTTTASGGTRSSRRVAAAAAASGADADASSETPTARRVLDFERQQDRRSGGRSDLNGQSQDHRHADSKGAGDGAGGLDAAFEPRQRKATKQGADDSTDPTLELMSWLQTHYTHLAPPHTASTPSTHRDELYAHMAIDSPASVSLPSKDRIAEVVLQAFPNGRWETGNTMHGLTRRGSPPASAPPATTAASSGTRNTRGHRYTASCNLSELAAVAAIEQESMNGGSQTGDAASDERRSLSQEGTEPQSPPGGGGRSGMMSPTRQAVFGTPRRSALDELAAAAALSERSPMAAGANGNVKAKRGDQDEGAGGATKRRKVAAESPRKSGANAGGAAGAASAASTAGNNKAWDPVWSQQQAIQVAQAFQTGALGIEQGPTLNAADLQQQQHSQEPQHEGDGASNQDVATIASYIAGGGPEAGPDAQGNPTSAAGSSLAPLAAPTKTNNRGSASTRRKGQKRLSSANDDGTPGEASSSRSAPSSSRKANKPPKLIDGKKNIYTNTATTSATDPMVKHYKPNFTYHELITHEIKRSTEGRLQLSEIYRRISERYPYFKLGEPGWQNSIRHNLSLKKCFVRVDRPSDSGDKSGKGGWWTYVAATDGEGRSGRKGLSGKGTGEYRKGSTPSDIASRSPTPEAIGNTHNADGTPIDPAMWGAHPHPSYAHGPYLHHAQQQQHPQSQQGPHLQHMGSNGPPHNPSEMPQFFGEANPYGMPSLRSYHNPYESSSAGSTPLQHHQHHQPQQQRQHSQHSQHDNGHGHQWSGGQEHESNQQQQPLTSLAEAHDAMQAQKTLMEMHGGSQQQQQQQQVE